MKIGVIGGGISGLSIAKILSEEQHEVILFEKENEVGGLIKCERINNCLFHKVGGHVFNSKNEEVLKWFAKHFDLNTEFVKAKRRAKILLNNEIIGYPIENHLYSLPKATIEQVISELINISKSLIKSDYYYDNFESFLRQTFGETLFKLYFEPYNRKVWNTDLNKVSMDWLAGKLPMPNLKDIIISNIFKEEETNMVHSYFYYPKYNGSQFIVDRLKEGLMVSTKTNIKDLSFYNKKILINGQTFEKLIYCGDIRMLPNKLKILLKQHHVDIDYLENLKANSTSNIFCETNYTDMSWLYLPDSSTKAHRIIYTGNFSNSNNNGSTRSTCVVEFSGKLGYQEMCKELEKLPGDLNPIGYNFEESSYIIHDHKTAATIKRVKRVLETYHIYLLGRFAEWEYYNMDKVIENAILLAKKISLQN